MQVSQFGKQLAAERERVPPPVVIAADRELRPVRAPQQQALDGRGTDARLVPEHQDEHLGALIDGAERGGDRR